MNTTAIDIQVHVLKTQHLNFKNYCFIVENVCAKEIVLVDPSWEFELIDQTIKQLSAKPCAVLLTHHHYDHIDLAEKCAIAYNIPVFMSSNEINFYNFTCAHLHALPQKSFWVNSFFIQCIATPGHTYGSICYLIGNNLFTGDTLFNEGCGICIDNGSCPEQLFYSLQAIKNIINNATLIYPGHQFYSTIGRDFAFVKEQNIYLHFNKVEQFVAFRMRKQNTANWLNFK